LFAYIFLSFCQFFRWLSVSFQVNWMVAVPELLFPSAAAKSTRLYIAAQTVCINTVQQGDNELRPILVHRPGNDHAFGVQYFMPR
jgi:hypothetical protein